MVSFTCYSCVQECNASLVGCCPLENEQLRKLCDPLAPLASPFPIIDRSGKAHLIQLDQELVEALRLPHSHNGRTFKTIFQCLQHLFWQQDGFKCQNWLDYDLDRGVEFEPIDNIHLFNKTLTRWRQTSREGLGPQHYAVEPHGHYNGEKVTYTYYTPTSINLQTYNAFRGAMPTSGIWHQLQKGRNDIYNSLVPKIPEATQHKWTIEEQAALHHLFHRQKYNGNFVQAIGQIARDYAQDPWSTIEYLFKSQHAHRSRTLPVVAMQSASTSQWSEDDMFKAKQMILDNLTQRFGQTHMDIVPNLLLVLTYRICTNQNRSPPAWSSWARGPLPKAPRASPRYSFTPSSSDFEKIVKASNYTAAELKKSMRSICRKGLHHKGKDLEIAEEFFRECSKLPAIQSQNIQLEDLCKFLGSTLSGKQWEWLQLPTKGPSKKPRRRLVKTEKLERIYTPLKTQRTPDRERPDLILWLKKNIDFPTTSQPVTDKKRNAKPSYTQRKQLRKAGYPAQASLLNIQLRQLRKASKRASFGSLTDQRWPSIKAKLCEDKVPAAQVSHISIYFVDVEAWSSSDPILFSGSILREDAGKVDPGVRITQEQPRLTNSQARFDFVIRHTKSLELLPNEHSIYGWVARQYDTANWSRQSWGLDEDQVEQHLRALGFDEKSSGSNIMLAWTVNNNQWDKRVLAKLPGCDQILPDVLSPSSLLPPLGWTGRIALEVVIRAFMLDPEHADEREYCANLLEHAHLPWIDNELCRIATRYLLSFYE